jgi:hypothetical protein
MDRVPQGLAARSRRTCPERSRGNPDAAYPPMQFGAFQPPKPDGLWIIFHHPVECKVCELGMMCA